MTDVSSDYEIVTKLHDSSVQLLRNRVAGKSPDFIKVLKLEAPTASALHTFFHEYEITKELKSIIVPQMEKTEHFYGRNAIKLHWRATEALTETRLSKKENSQPLFDQREHDILLSQLPPLANNPSSLHDYWILVLQIAQQLVVAVDELSQKKVAYWVFHPNHIIFSPKRQCIQLIDFRYALPFEQIDDWKSVHLYPDVWNYLSPEQLGSAPTNVDQRSGLYSLGILLYELIGGRLPLITSTHSDSPSCQNEFDTPTLQTIIPALPSVLANIIMKLLEKQKEQRYQTPFGLKRDLEHCIDQLEKTGSLTHFELGRFDQIPPFQPPPQIYGRQKEIQGLINFLKRSSLLSPSLALVTGESGIGKTRVVREALKQITAPHTFVLFGKYPSPQQSTPYSAINEVIQNLVSQIQAQGPEALQFWKTKFLSTLGENLKLLIEQVPNLEMIVGALPPLEPLLPSQAQQRFHITLQRFFSLLSNQGYSLIVFLDDLHWADTGSLELLEEVLNPSMPDLKIIGAFREEAPLDPRLEQLIAKFNQQKKAFTQIHLAPLPPTEIKKLVFATMPELASTTTELVDFIVRKVGGNPFVVIETLRKFHNESVSYSHEQVTQIIPQFLEQSHLNLVELIHYRFNRLPSTFKEILKIAACLGNPIDLDCLQAVTKIHYRKLMDNIEAIFKEGVLIKTQHDFFFAHDSLLETIVTMIPVSTKQTFHAQIGHYLYEKYEKTKAPQPQEVFKYTQHLNLAADTIDDSKSVWLAELNLQAGQLAKSSGAFKESFEFLKTGIDRLPKNPWETHYSLTLSLYTEYCEATYLNKKFETLPKLLETTLDQAQHPLDRIKIREIQITFYCGINQFDQSLKIGLLALEELNILLPDNTTQKEIFSELQQLDAKIQKLNKPVLELPQMENTEYLAAMKVMFQLIPTLYNLNSSLYPLVVLRMVNLSIENGNVPFSAFAYSNYGVILGLITQDHIRALSFGNIGIRLAKYYQSHDIMTNVYLVGGLIHHWHNPLQESLPLLETAIRSGEASGNIQGCAYAIAHWCHFTLLTSKSLEDVENIYITNEKFLKKLGHENALLFLNLCRQWMHLLIEAPKSPIQLQGSHFEEKSALELWQKINDRPALAIFFTLKSALSYLYEDYPMALDLAKKALPYIDSIAMQYWYPVHCFFHSLALSANFMEFKVIQRKEALAILHSHKDHFQQWAKESPENYSALCAFIEAECAFIQENYKEAEEFYDQGIRLTQKYKLKFYEGIGEELVAKFYLESQKDVFARAYFQEAYQCFALWGATGKTEWLEQNHHLFISSHPPTEPPPTQQSLNHPQQLIEKASIFQENRPLTGFPTNESPSSTSTITILVIDKDPANLHTIHNYLHLSYRLVMCTTGAQAIEYINEQTKPDLVLLGMTLPDFSGYQVAESIRAQYNKANLPIIFLSEANQLKTLADASQYGGNDYIAQPFHREELLVRVEHQLQILRVIEKLESIKRFSNRIAPPYHSNSPFTILEEELKGTYFKGFPIWIKEDQVLTQTPVPFGEVLLRLREDLLEWMETHNQTISLYSTHKLDFDFPTTLASSLTGHFAFIRWIPQETLVCLYREENFPFFTDIELQYLESFSIHMTSQQRQFKEFIQSIRPRLEELNTLKVLPLPVSAKTPHAFYEIYEKGQKQKKAFMVAPFITTDTLYVYRKNKTQFVVYSSGDESEIQTPLDFLELVYEDHLLRIHRSYLINMNKVVKIEETPGQKGRGARRSYDAILRGSTQFYRQTIGRTYLKAVKKRFAHLF